MMKNLNHVLVSGALLGMTVFFCGSRAAATTFEELQNCHNALINNGSNATGEMHSIDGYMITMDSTASGLYAYSADKAFHCDAKGDLVSQIENFRLQLGQTKTLTISYDLQMGDESASENALPLDPRTKLKLKTLNCTLEPNKRALEDLTRTMKFKLHGASFGQDSKASGKIVIARCSQIPELHTELVKLLGAAQVNGTHSQSPTRSSNGAR